MTKNLMGLAAALTMTVLAVSPARADGDPKRGEKIFEECRACHPPERGAHGGGPDLHGVFGRRAGEPSDFRYSPALKRSGITWTPQTLDTYVADPQKAIPANRMPYSGIPDARDRADLIAYMQQVFK